MRRRCGTPSKLVMRVRFPSPAPNHRGSAACHGEDCGADRGPLLQACPFMPIPRPRRSSASHLRGPRIKQQSEARSPSHLDVFICYRRCGQGSADGWILRDR
jgi:hypothetical protein